MCNYKWFIEHLVFYLSGPHIHFHSFNSIKYLINLLNCLVSQLNVNICFGLACAASRAILLSAHTYVHTYSHECEYKLRHTHPPTHMQEIRAPTHACVVYAQSYVYINIDMENQCNGKQFKFKVSHTMSHSGITVRCGLKIVKHCESCISIGSNRYNIDR